MANTDAPNGFRPYRGSANGNPKIGYHVLNTTNSALGVGTVVAIVAGGTDVWASGALLGIAAEAKAANAGGTASTKMLAVWDDPEQEFTAQTDNGTGTSTAEAAVGLNIDILNPSSVTSGRSTSELDETSATTTATLPLKILGLESRPDNAFGEFNRLVVKINNHQLKGGTGTAGV